MLLAIARNANRLSIFRVRDPLAAANAAIAVGPRLWLGADALLLGHTMSVAYRDACVKRQTAADLI